MPPGRTGEFLGYVRPAASWRRILLSNAVITYLWATISRYAIGDFGSYGVDRATGLTHGGARRAVILRPGNDW
jgi:hypothetical protein